MLALVYTAIAIAPLPIVACIAFPITIIREIGT
jgi:hypothetical protein